MTDTALSRPLAATGPSLRALLWLAGRIDQGCLTLTLPDGSQRTFTGRLPGPQAALTIHRPRLARRLLAGGAIGLAESYMDGDWDSPDLTALLHLAGQNEAGAFARAGRGGFLTRLSGRILHTLRANTRAGSRRNIARHYDLGNDFYRLWLDDSMTYSAGIFDRDDDDLGVTQRRKFARLADIAGLQPGQHVLEIGCGWGGFAAYAAGERGCRVTAVTISPSQHAFAAERLTRLGLNDRVDLRLMDYRDIDGRFDAIVSIEMLEAVGERYWPLYFDRLYRHLRPGGRAALQVITIDEDAWDGYKREPDFIQRYIFPGGMLPRRSTLHDLMAGAGLQLVDDCGFGRDYALTLRDWHQRFEAAWPEITAQGFDDRFRRMWRYYLAYCEAGFWLGRIDVRQFAIQRPPA
jgi:cyclopropane-fatty-acyl-phospholipid synthase